jgi:sulfite dehydrogenase (cytochrome) subunit B
MRNKTARLFQTAAIFALGVGGGTKLNLTPQLKRDASQATQVVHQRVDNESVHTITLPHDEPLFGPGPGREEFITACVVCHSPRYITMQPRFPRSTWLSEVKKMKDVYGAHISDEQAAKITDYLVSINGKADAGNAPRGTYGE